MANNPSLMWRPWHPRCAPSALVLATILTVLPLWPLVGQARQSPSASTAGTLAGGFRLYSSRVLPYSIAYPPGWHADGSLFGMARPPAGVYFDADTFSKRGIGSIEVWSEILPSGSSLTSAGYAEVLLLDLRRGEDMDARQAYTATRLGTVTVGGERAYLFDVRRGRGPEALYTTEAVFVTARRGWRIGLTTVVTGAARAALRGPFTLMLGTFRLR